MTLSWQVNDSLTIKSLTGFRSIDTDVYQDYASAFSSVGVPWTTGFRTFDELETDQFTQEFQFLGSFGERVDYLVGLYYFNEDGDHGQRIDIDIPGLPPAFGGPIFIDKDRQVEAESTSEAIFAQVTWTPEVLDDRLELTFGGRYTSDNRKATRTTFNSMQSPGYTGPIGVEPDFNVPPAFGNSIDEDFSKFNPSFTANMRWDDDLSTYLRIATGYKAGGIAESGDVGTFNEAFVFDPEEVLTYELGLKSELVDNTVRVNLALFYSEFDDMQVGFNTNPADLSVTLLQNAGEATISGAELEAMWAPIDSLTLALNASYLDPSIDRMEALAGTIFDPARNPASPYQVGDNIIAYKDPGGQFKIYYKGETTEMESYYPANYTIQYNSVAYMNTSNTLRLFTEGEAYDVTNAELANWQLNYDVITYQIGQGIFKVFYKGNEY